MASVPRPLRPQHPRLPHRIDLPRHSKPPLFPPKLRRFHPDHLPPNPPNPPLSLLFFLCLFIAWVYLVIARDDPLTVLDYDVGFLTIATLGALFWSHVWMKLFVSLLIGAVLMLVHGVLRAPEDSIEDSPYGSLLNVVDSPRGGYASV